MSWPAPTSSAAAMATMLQASARSRACSRPCSRAASRTKRMTRAPALPPSPRSPLRPVVSGCEIRRSGSDTARKAGRLDHSAGLGRRADRAGGQSQARVQAEAETGCAGFRRAEAADAGRYHQFPWLLGRRTEGGEPGDPRPGRSAARTPGARRRHRSAADRQRHRSVQQGDGLRAGRVFAGRPRQRRRRHRAGPAASRPSGAQCRRRRDRNQYRGRQGRAGSGQPWSRPRPVSPPPRAAVSGCAW